jgi:hypothetical protein
MSKKKYFIKGLAVFLLLPFLILFFIISGFVGLIFVLGGNIDGVDRVLKFQEKYIYDRF